VAVSCYHLILEEGPDLSDSSNDASVPDEEPNMCTPGCEAKDARLSGPEAFLL
jgi:hypothetical protein